MNLIENIISRCQTISSNLFINMIENKKIVYIFTALTKNSFSKKKKLTIFDKFLLKFSKKEKVLKKEDTNLKKRGFDSFLKNISCFREKKSFFLDVNLEKPDLSLIETIEKEKADSYFICSIYPQYCNQMKEIANFFSLNIKVEVLDKFYWIKSYYSHPIFLETIKKNIKKTLLENNLDEKDTFLLFAASNNTDNKLYNFEIETTANKIIKNFPYLDGGFLDFDFSKILRKNIILCSISTLEEDVEIKETLKIDLKKEKINLFFTPKLIDDQNFIRSIFDIIDEKNFITNDMLF